MGNEVSDIDAGARVPREQVRHLIPGAQLDLDRVRHARLSWGSSGVDNKTRRANRTGCYDCRVSQPVLSWGMTRRLGVVMDPISSISPQGDSTLAMLLDAAH